MNDTFENPTKRHSARLDEGLITPSEAAGSDARAIDLLRMSESCHLVARIVELAFDCPGKPQWLHGSKHRVVCDTCGPTLQDFLAESRHKVLITAAQTDDGQFIADVVLFNLWGRRIAQTWLLVEGDLRAGRDRTIELATDDALVVKRLAFAILKKLAPTLI